MRFTSKLGAHIKGMVQLRQLVLDNPIAYNFGIVPFLAEILSLTLLTCLVLSTPKDVNTSAYEVELYEDGKVKILNQRSESTETEHIDCILGDCETLLSWIWLDMMQTRMCL